MCFREDEFCRVDGALGWLQFLNRVFVSVVKDGRLLGKIWCAFVCGYSSEINGTLIFPSFLEWNVSLAGDNKKFQRSMGRIRKYRPSLNIVGQSEIASRCDPLYLYTIFHLIVFNTPPPQKKEQMTAKPTFCRPLFRTVMNVPLNLKR